MTPPATREAFPRGGAATTSAGRGVVAALVALLAALCVASLAIGPAALPPLTALRALVVDDGAATIILREIRLPRTALALLIGAVLAGAGAVMQGLLRNPLAEPAVFGAPQAAALVAVAGLHFFALSPLGYALPLAAISGAFASVAGIVALAGRSGSMVGLALAGLAIGGFASALTALVIALAPNPFAVTELVFWLMGSLEERTMTHLGLLAPFAGIALLLFFLSAGRLRALVLGDESAASLGIDLTRLRWLVIAGVALGVGASVAIAGAIGFVGLVAPHLMRPLVGADPRRLLLPAMLAGACLLLAADIMVRLMPSQGEIRLGVVTALLGAPFFFAIALRARRTPDVAP